MSKHTPIDWASHLENLKEWDKSLAEYAKIHNLNARILYHKRSVLKKLKNKSQIKPDPKQKTHFMPIKITGQSAKVFSIKIYSGSLTYDLSGLSIAALKELLHSARSN